MTYFCASPTCPGYPYKASDQPHPVLTCHEAPSLPEYVEPAVTYRSSRIFDCKEGGKLTFIEIEGGIVVRIEGCGEVTLTPEQWKDLQASTYHLKPRPA